MQLAGLRYRRQGAVPGAGSWGRGGRDEEGRRVAANCEQLGVPGVAQAGAGDAVGVPVPALSSRVSDGRHCPKMEVVRSGLRADELDDSGHERMATRLPD